MHWNAGYVSDIGYTYGYYPELNPLRVEFAMALAGYRSNQPSSACELGFGQGLSINFHSAATMSAWTGTDFNPSHVAYAQSLGNLAGIEAQLLDRAFEEYAAALDGREFDFIAMHGIWSWVNAENKGVLVDIVKEHLAVGGVLYTSYNTLPGWNAFAPIRHLMKTFHDASGKGISNVRDAVAAAIAFAEKVLATNPVYLRANPSIAGRLEKLKTQDPNYIAHEYFNDVWTPMYFSEKEEWLQPAKLTYVTSADLLQNVPVLHLTQEQQEILAEASNNSVRETQRDLMLNTQFRKDYWVKGPSKMTALEHVEVIRELRIVLLVPASKIEFSVVSVLGEVNMNKDVYQPIVDLIADYQVHTVADLEKQLTGKGIEFAQLVQAITILVGKNYVAPAQNPEQIASVESKCKRMNAVLCDRACFSGDVNYLVSPVTGGGVEVPRFLQLFIKAITVGFTSSEQWAQYTWQRLQAQGELVADKGTVLTTEQENLSFLRNLAAEFEREQLPILKQLKVA